ncbi:hypothetical protein [Salinispora cortesiana]|uniref:hypothetical protein n=1 Tax=Salinispora cortesiana TaxID=1305843 RepID=UPI00041170DA|nr:hypothetical protein [Salinispora cortesiana]
MADHSRPEELRPRRDPSGPPRLPDGDRVHPEYPPDINPPTARQKLVTALIVVIVVTAIVIGAFR